MKVAVKSLICLIVFGGILQTEFSPLVDAATAPSAPKLINTCLVTKNVSRLSDFYEKVLGIKPQKVANRYAEFHTGVGVLAIFSAEAQQEYIPGSAEASKNRSAILEFKVADVDQQYVRLQTIVATWVKKPTTQPWGTRSIYFRDPDGNLIDFYMPAPSR